MDFIVSVISWLVLEVVWAGVKSLFRNRDAGDREGRR